MGRELWGESGQVVEGGCGKMGVESTEVRPGVGEEWLVGSWQTTPTHTHTHTHTYTHTLTPAST